MSKHIVICTDGTWNDPTDQTNVYKLFQTLDFGQQQPLGKTAGVLPSRVLEKKGEHVAYYLEGVGADGTQEEWLGGALGTGLHSRVLDAYILASQSYEPGDRLWLFGFSRGAWTARSLAGMISRVGLLQGAELVGDVRHQAQERWIEAKNAKAEKRGDAFWKQQDHAIELVGVWDTVGALGIPFFNGLRMMDSLEHLLFDFADQKLHRRVRHGRHALAIDERRGDFLPTLWQERSGVEQVWFAGVHADVGGGYPERELADISLDWMLDEFAVLAPNLPLNRGNVAPPIQENRPQGNRHDETQNPVWKLRPQQWRSLPANARIHPSVQERMARRPDYRPRALSTFAQYVTYFGDAAPSVEAVYPTRPKETSTTLATGQSQSFQVMAEKWWNACHLAVRKGERYALVANGDWMDKDHHSSPDGYASGGNFALRALEFSRRVEDANWFALIAAVSPAEDLEARNGKFDGMLTGAWAGMRGDVGRIDKECQLVTIGAGKELHVEKDGYLYLFANDTIAAYGNNSGYLTVTVKRVE